METAFVLSEDRYDYNLMDYHFIFEENVVVRSGKFTL